MKGVQFSVVIFDEDERGTVIGGDFKEGEKGTVFGGDFSDGESTSCFYCNGC